jgi:hypothetical protein
VPVRIYALAKDLNLDSKELVEICRKAGIPGKGSALASLTDEEAEKVKGFLSGEKKKPERRLRGPVRRRARHSRKLLEERLHRAGPWGASVYWTHLASPPRSPREGIRGAQGAQRSPGARSPTAGPRKHRRRRNRWRRTEATAAGASGAPQPLGNPRTATAAGAAAAKQPREIRESREVRDIKDLRDCANPRTRSLRNRRPTATPRRREAVIKLAEAPQLKQPPVKPPQRNRKPKNPTSACRRT